MILELYHGLLRPHPSEAGRPIGFQEEARAERLSNSIRIIYVLTWMIFTGLHARENVRWANVANLTWGTWWVVWAFGVQAWLHRYPYRPQYKFITTTMDIFIVTGMLWTYQFVSPAFAFKTPTFLNYFCCMGLVSLRFNRRLAVFGALLTLALYLCVVMYIEIYCPVAYGTNIEHINTFKVNQHYVGFQFAYLAMFGFLTFVAAVNAKRLVELRTSENEAALQAKEHSKLAAGVAHEIKNPLEGIYGAAQLLRDEGKANPRYVEMILKDAVRLNETVQQFLSFSRPLPIKAQRFDLVGMVNNFCQEQIELNPEASLNFSSETAAFDLFSDSEALRQILLNLVQNARRFQMAGKPVRLILKAHDRAVEIDVEDDGAGVSEEQRTRLFEPFFTTSSKGTGLGLAISRKIARELGGDLYFESLQPGSRFVLMVKPHPGQDGGAT